MASYQHLLQHTKPGFESPAKVFAKLKSKVQREMCANKRILTSTDPRSNARKKHEAEGKSPKKRRADSSSMTEELEEKHRFDSYHSEMQPLTLSPIPSPQKTFELTYSDVSSSPTKMTSHLINTGHRWTPRRRAILESTYVLQPHYSSGREQIQTEPPPIRDVEGFSVISRTVASRQTTEDAFEESGAPLKSSPSVFTHSIRSRLRKRKWQLNEVSGRTKEVSGGVVHQPQERKSSSALSRVDNHNNTWQEDVSPVRGISAGPAETDHFPPPPCATRKRCSFIMEKIPPMSPAKIFAYMKQRGSKKEQREAHKIRSNTRGFSARDHDPDEADAVALTSDPDTVAPVNRSHRVESHRSQSDTELSEDATVPAVPPQPVLFEDPLILNSPRVIIPKKNEAVFKRKSGPQPIIFPSESVIYLKKWYLMKAPKGLYVEGIHREERIPWNSNVIVDRVSNYVLKTVSGRVYMLLGKMNLHADTGLPKWLLKEFVCGFPPNWKALYDKFLSESKNDPRRETVRNRGKGIAAKTKSEALKKNPLRTPDSCPPSSSSSTTVSRSGRVIKPPLEYWRGGRVVVDAYMNVTIHEGYDASFISNPANSAHEVTTVVSARASRKPAGVVLPCSEGHKQCELDNVKETSRPLRKVKAPLHRHKKAKVSPESKPSHCREPPTETQSSSDEGCGRRTRSSQRRSPTERNCHVNAVPQKQSKTKEPSTQRSTGGRHDTSRPPLRVSDKRPVEAPPQSPVNDKASQDESSIRRKRQNRRGHRSKGEKSQPSDSSEESGTDLRMRIRATGNRDAAEMQKRKHGQRKCTETSQSPKPPTKTKSTQSTKKPKAEKGKTLIPQEQDEDQWTESELTRLKEAVAFYPKHVAGYWEKVARTVGTRSAEECYNQHTSPESSQTPAKRAKKPNKKRAEPPKDTDHPVISARVGTLKRKQQVRQFLETMPRENVDDVFSSDYMQNKRFEIPSMCPSDDHDFPLSDLEPMTPMSTGLPEAKTPQCLHITPGMMGSPNRSDDDRYVYQLQKRMKKSRFNVCTQAPSSKKIATTPSVKRTLRECRTTENDSSVFWEMFPGNNGALSESGEEEDFYFSEND